MNIPSQITTLLAGIILTLVSLWYGQNHNLLPLAATEQAPLIDSLFGAMLTIGTGIFLLVNGILIYASFRYRRQDGDTSDGPHVHGNIPLEILWTAIPAIIVLAISIYSFDIYTAEGGMDPMDHASHHTGQHQMAEMPGAAMAATLDDPNQSQSAAVQQDPATQAIEAAVPERRDAPEMGVASPRLGTGQAQPDFVVNAAGMQYAWLFSYPGTEVVAGELHVPVGRQVQLNISANDVLHAFWVPEFRVKQDAVPGRQTELRFKPTKEGTYPVICAELCGAYHGVMKTQVVVESEAAFQSWLQTMVASTESGKTTIAANPATMTDAEYLAPYAKDMGVTPAALHHLQAHQS